MNKIVAQLLIVILLFPALSPAKTKPIGEQVKRIPTGANVEVRLHNQERLRARLGPVGSDSFEITTVNKVTGEMAARTLAFTEVKSVKKVAHKKRTALLVTAGVTATAAALFGIVLARGFPFPSDRCLACR